MTPWAESTLGFQTLRAPETRVEWSRGPFGLLRPDLLLFLFASSVQMFSNIPAFSANITVPVNQRHHLDINHSSIKKRDELNI